jgi:hypothetical protein
MLFVKDVQEEKSNSNEESKENNSIIHDVIENQQGKCYIMIKFIYSLFNWYNFAQKIIK